MLFNVLFSVAIGLVILYILNVVLDLRLLNDLKKLVSYIVDSIANHNTKKYLERKIVKTNDNIISKYNRLVENIIFDYNLPLTLEGFNSFISILFAILVLIVVLFLKDITLSALVSISLLVGAITYFTMR